MAGETVITVVGNLVDDPELRFTPSGAAVAKFRVASTPRIFDRQTNEWKDGEGLFLTCSVWRQAAENVAESLQRGMRVVVQGRLKQRSYEDREGVKRTVYELDVEEVGPSLKNATAKVTKTTGRGGQGGGQGGYGGGQQGGGNWGGGPGGGGQQGGGGAPADDPWATSAPSGGQQGGGQQGGGQQGGGGGWGGSSGGSGGSGGGYSDEPPF
ncbi:single-stranded DNA-binding protein [Streptomyces sp. NPDC095614]|uniref:single-stranded DNA-binding protein n=1 Tax=Streptomyces sp. NPDC095614 TaxID=3156692 RepID=UPI003329C727